LWFAGLHDWSISLHICGLPALPICGCVLCDLRVCGFPSLRCWRIPGLLVWLRCLRFCGLLVCGFACQWFDGLLGCGLWNCQFARPWVAGLRACGVWFACSLYCVSVRCRFAVLWVSGMRMVGLLVCASDGLRVCGSVFAGLGVWCSAVRGPDVLRFACLRFAGSWVCFLLFVDLLFRSLLVCGLPVYRFVGLWFTCVRVCSFAVLLVCGSPVCESVFCCLRVCGFAVCWSVVCRFTGLRVCFLLFAGQRSAGLQFASLRFCGGAE